MAISRHSLVALTGAVVLTLVGCAGSTRPPHGATDSTSKPAQAPPEALNVTISAKAPASPRVTAVEHDGGTGKKAGESVSFRALAAEVPQGGTVNAEIVNTTWVIPLVASMDGGSYSAIVPVPSSVPAGTYVVQGVIETRNGDRLGSFVATTPLVVTKLASTCADFVGSLGDTVVLFDLDDSTIRNDARSTLGSLSASLKQPAAQGVTLQIGGYTDIRGTIGYNVSLSERRAISARDYLAALGAVNQDRVSCIPYGEEAQIARGPEQNEEDWFAVNRRAVVRLMCPNP